jgi:Replication-relaxation
MKTANKQKLSASPLVLTEPLVRILRATHFYRFLVAQDICRLYWSLSSLTYVRDLLANLAKHKYLYRFQLPSVHSGGIGAERIYTLGAAGRKFMEKSGFKVDWYYRPHRIKLASYGAAVHNVLLSRTLIAASVWAKKQPNFKLVKTRICYELAREAPSIQLTNDKGEREMVKVIPDAYLLFQKLNNNKHERFYQIILELDRGTEFKQRLIKAIRTRLEYIKDSGAYRRLLGMEPKNVILAYITTGDRPEYRESRRRAMCNWTMEVLAQSGLNNLPCSFLFCSVVASEIYNIPLFDGAGWFRPGDSSPVSLFTP